MSSFQKWLLGLLTALGIGAGAVVVTKPTSPTPPPVVSDTTHHDSTPVVTPPSPVPISSLDLISDHFTQYKNTAAFLANVSTAIGGTGSPSTSLYNDGVNPTLASIDPTVLYNGHQTLKYTQPGGTAATPELWTTFGTSKPLSILWYRVKVRFSPGFTTTGTIAGSANAYKLLGWGWNTYDGSGRLEITNTNQYQLYWNVQAKNTGTLVGGGVYGLGGNITTEWTDGNWYDYIIQVDFSKSPNGVAKVWMATDGHPPVLKATSSASMNSGQGPLPGITTIDIGMNFNQNRSATQAQALWIGQWEVISGTDHPNPFGL